ncbi:MAG TPA: hypothetical protein DIC60_04675, partial [Lachnospiraceae bacterium]|nr:hypothetical protein [Lachnospiraceae bacterium]
MKLQKIKRFLSVTILVVILLVSILSVSTQASASIMGNTEIRPVFAVNPLKAFFDFPGAIHDFFMSLIAPIARAPIDRMNKALLTDSNMAEYLEYGSGTNDAAQNRMQRWFDIFELAGLAFLPLIVLRAAILLIGAFTSPSDRSVAKEFIKNVILYIAILLFAKDVILWLVQINDAIVALFAQAAQQTIQPPLELNLSNMSTTGLIALLLVLLGTYLLSFYIWVLMFVRKVVIGLAFALIPVAAIMIFSSKFRSVIKTLYDELMSAVFQQSIYAGAFVILYDLLVFIIGKANGDLTDAANGTTSLLKDAWGGWFTQNVDVTYASGASGELTVLGPLGWIIFLLLFVKIAKKIEDVFKLQSQHVPPPGDIIKGAAGMGAVLGGVIGAGVLTSGVLPGGRVASALGGGMLEKATGYVGEKFSKGKWEQLGLGGFGKLNKGWSKGLNDWNQKTTSGKIGGAINFAKKQGAGPLALAGKMAGVSVGELGTALFPALKLDKDSSNKEFYKNKFKGLENLIEENDEHHERIGQDTLTALNYEKGEEIKKAKIGNDTYYAKQDKNGKNKFVRRLADGTVEKLKDKDAEDYGLNDKVDSWKTFGGTDSKIYDLRDGTSVLTVGKYDSVANGVLNGRHAQAASGTVVGWNALSDPTSGIDRSGAMETKIRDAQTAGEKVFFHADNGMLTVTSIDGAGKKRLVDTGIIQTDAHMTALGFDPTKRNELQTAAVQMTAAGLEHRGAVEVGNIYDQIMRTEATIHSSNVMLNEQQTKIEESVRITKSKLVIEEQQLETLKTSGTATVAQINTQMKAIESLNYTIKAGEATFE